MKVTQQIFVIDAANVDDVSAFWAGVFGGEVVKDEEDGWHIVLVDGEWKLAVQPVPHHVPPSWADGQQQIHLDMKVDDIAAAHDEVIALGGAVLQRRGEASDAEGYWVFADPAGHPFCLFWD